MRRKVDDLADVPLPVTIHDIQPVYQGFRRLERMSLSHRSLDGTHDIGPLDRLSLRVGEAAMIIPYDPALDRIVAIRQFRVGAALSTPHAAALELPAGLVDAGERADEAAPRELTEETGLQAQAIEFCFAFLSAPGLTDERVSVFLALVDSSKLEEAAGLAEEHEDIRPIAADAEALIAAVDRGAVENGPLIVCIHWFARHGRARAAALARRSEAGEAAA